MKRNLKQDKWACDYLRGQDPHGYSKPGAVVGADMGRWDQFFTHSHGAGVGSVSQALRKPILGISCAWDKRAREKQCLDCPAQGLLILTIPNHTALKELPKPRAQELPQRQTNHSCVNPLGFGVDGRVALPGSKHFIQDVLKAFVDGPDWSTSLIRHYELL